MRSAQDTLNIVQRYLAHIYIISKNQPWCKDMLHTYILYQRDQSLCRKKKKRKNTCS